MTCNEYKTSRINMRESNIFPFSEYEIRITSVDCEFPVFYIIRNGWNISFEIESGNKVDVITRGDNEDDYDYISNNIHDWLNGTCALIPSISNRENAMAQWIQLNEFEMRERIINRSNYLSVTEELNERYAEEVANRFGLKYYQQSCIMGDDLDIMKQAKQIISRKMDTEDIKVPFSRNYKWAFVFNSNERK